MTYYRESFLSGLRAPAAGIDALAAVFTSPSHLCEGYYAASCVTWVLLWASQGAGSGVASGEHGTPVRSGMP